MSSHAYDAGLAFHQALIDGSVGPPTYPALIRDLAIDLERLRPALLDLVSRQAFHALPWNGSAAEKLLSRDALLTLLEGLYRDEVLSQLNDFIEGVLGFVEDESVDDCPLEPDLYGVEEGALEAFYNWEDVMASPEVCGDWLESSAPREFGELGLSSYGCEKLSAPVLYEDASQGSTDGRGLNVSMHLFQFLIHPLALLSCLFFVDKFWDLIRRLPVAFSLVVIISLSLAALPMPRLRDGLFLIFLIALFWRVALSRGESGYLILALSIPLFCLLLSFPVAGLLRRFCLIDACRRIS